ncbi:MAG: DUF4259 domain-containing protein, partial [Pseudomonadota bacterium]
EIDADEASAIVAAAECVAAMRGHPDEAMPHELAQTVHRLGKPSTELWDSARNSLSAVVSSSELTELWAEAEEDDRAAFNRAITDLIDRLNQPQGKAKKPKKPVGSNPNPSPCMFCDKPMGDGAFHMIDITVNEDEISSMKQGGWVHLACLNAALHPKHMIQNWEVDDELLDFVMAKIEAENSED